MLKLSTYENILWVYIIVEIAFLVCFTKLIDATHCNKVTNQGGLKSEVCVFDEITTFFGVLELRCLVPKTHFVLCIPLC